MTALDPAQPAGRPPAPSLTASVDQIRMRALFEMLPVSMTVGLLVALGVAGVLQGAVDRRTLLLWVGARAFMTMARIGHGQLFSRWSASGALHHWYWPYVALALIDGTAWGALGWSLTPLQDMQVAVVSISVLIGVAALGVFMLHVDFLVAVCFITPILLPNAIYCTWRHDALGWFGAAAVAGLVALLVLESWRSNKRIIELLRLRLQSEEVAAAQAEALHQAHLHGEAKSRFLATMSHEMRTPLHGILGLTRLLRQDAADLAARHRLDLIHSSGEHLLSVINDVLDFSRMEANGLPIHEQAFDLRELVGELVETARLAAADKGLRLTLFIDRRLREPLMGDPVRVRQVLHNLVSNAVKFTEHGEVRVRARRDEGDGGVLIEVEDTGIGIAPQEVERIFEAFHQAEGTYQRRFGGTGLGLTISRELARAMGGDLRCVSQPGTGSVFALTLPLPVAEGVAGEAPREGQSDWYGLDHDEVAPPPRLPPAHVLLVEDHVVNAMIAEAELKRMGVRVTVVNNGWEALGCLEQKQVDLVLMDCEMPGLDGFETARYARQREREKQRKAIPIIALTANGQEAWRERCFDAGMNDHVAKPFRSEALQRVLSRHLAARTGQAPAPTAAPAPHGLRDTAPLKTPTSPTYR